MTTPKQSAPARRRRPERRRRAIVFMSCRICCRLHEPWDLAASSSTCPTCARAQERARIEARGNEEEAR